MKNENILKDKKIRKKLLKRNSPLWKILTIGVLVLLLFIPQLSILSMVRERENRSRSVVEEVSQKWSRGQTITGPYLSVPYETAYPIQQENFENTEKRGNNQEILGIRYLHILPEQLEVEGNLKSETRSRGIYEAIVYNSNLSIRGKFIPVEENTSKQIDTARVFWDKAEFVLGVSDLRGIQKEIRVKMNGDEQLLNPGVPSMDLIETGLSFNLSNFEPNKEHPFSLEIDLSGSEHIYFVPVGAEIKVRLQSDWPNPSFDGEFLPTERDVEDNGFNANWKILRFSRSFPQIWTGNQYAIQNTAFGVKLLQPVNVYQQTERVVKYSQLFVVLVFAAFFLVELLTRNPVHIISYMLIGLSICIFYVLLLSLSEYLRFGFAYLLSAAATSLLIIVYTRAISRERVFPVTLTGVVTGLYAYFYIVLQLEDYALIVGSVGLFVLLSVTMYFTRKMNWHTGTLRD